MKKTNIYTHKLRLSLQYETVQETNEKTNEKKTNANELTS